MQYGKVMQARIRLDHLSGMHRDKYRFAKICDMCRSRVLDEVAKEIERIHKEATE